MESRSENGNSSILKVTKSILLKVLLFQLSGRGVELLNEVSFVSGFQMEGGQNVK